MGTERLTDRSVATIVKAYAGRAGFDASTFSGHSLRSGFLTSAAAKGASIFKMIDVSRREFRGHFAGLRPGCRIVQGSCGRWIALS